MSEIKALNNICDDCEVNKHILINAPVPNRAVKPLNQVIIKNLNDNMRNNCYRIITVPF